MLERLKLGPQTHIYIYLESVSPGECHKYTHMGTPPLLKKKEAKNGIFDRELNGATDLKLWHAYAT